jgi:hypothetical protein
MAMDKSESRAGVTSQSNSASRPSVPVAGPAKGTAAETSAESVFVPSPEAIERRKGRWLWIGGALLASLAIVAVGVMVAWPQLKPRPRDAVERVAEDYLKALVRQDEDAARKLSTVDEPPGIRSVKSLGHQKNRDRRLKGSFAPIAALHGRISKQYDYDPDAGRFTPKNPLGIAGETLDALHEAKEDAEESGLYKKMESGNPNDLFEAAEQYGKVFEKLASGALSPKRILPTYKMLVESAKPPLPEDAKALALEAADSLTGWEALLKRPFHTLRADGPFIHEQAEVTATVTDRLASLGDPPSRLRLKLVRFRLEGIDTGWKVVSARRIQPGVPETEQAVSPPKSLSSESTAPSAPPRSLHDVAPPEGE